MEKNHRWIFVFSSISLHCLFFFILKNVVVHELIKYAGQWNMPAGLTHRTHCHNEASDNVTEQPSWFTRFIDQCIESRIAQLLPG